MQAVILKHSAMGDFALYCHHTRWWHNAVQYLPCKNQNPITLAICFLHGLLLVLPSSWGKIQAWINKYLLTIAWQCPSGLYLQQLVPDCRLTTKYDDTPEPSRCDFDSIYMCICRQHAHTVYDCSGTGVFLSWWYCEGGTCPLWETRPQTQLCCR